MDFILALLENVIKSKITNKIWNILSTSIREKQKKKNFQLFVFGFEVWLNIYTLSWFLILQYISVPAGTMSVSEVNQNPMTLDASQIHNAECNNWRLSRLL